MPIVYARLWEGNSFNIVRLEAPETEIKWITVHGHPVPIKGGKIAYEKRFVPAIKEEPSERMPKTGKKIVWKTAQDISLRGKLGKDSRPFIRDLVGGRKPAISSAVKVKDDKYNIYFQHPDETKDYALKFTPEDDKIWIKHKNKLTPIKGAGKDFVKEQWGKAIGEKIDEHTIAEIKTASVRGKEYKPEEYFMSKKVSTPRLKQIANYSRDAKIKSAALTALGTR